MPTKRKKKAAKKKRRRRAKPKPISDAKLVAAVREKWALGSRDQDKDSLLNSFEINEHISGQLTDRLIEDGVPHVEWRLNIFAEKGLCTVVSQRGVALPEIFERVRALLPTFVGYVKGNATVVSDVLSASDGRTMFHFHDDFVEMVTDHEKLQELVDAKKISIRCNYHLEAIEQADLALRRRHSLIAGISDGRWNAWFDRGKYAQATGRMRAFARGVELAFKEQGTSFEKAAAELGVMPAELLQRLIDAVVKTVTPEGKKK